MSEQKWELIEEDGRMVIDGPVKTVTGPIKIDGELTFEDGEVEPGPDDPPGNGELIGLIEEAVTRVILEAPDYPEEFKVDGKVDARDFSVTISHEDLYKSRINEWPIEGGTPDQPGQGPAVNATAGTRGTVNIWDEGARGQSYSQDTAALANAKNKVKDGGTIFVPWGKWKISNLDMDTGKDIEIRGEGKLGAELVGKPGEDMLVFDDDGQQRRMQGRKIFRDLRFYMPGNGKKGNFNRRTPAGWTPGAACIATIARSKPAERKDEWGYSYIEIMDCTARGDKNAVGATFLYSERALYGLRVERLDIGDHGSTVSGLHGGIIFGEPPFRAGEYAPDEFRVETFIHWGGVNSIAVSNIANGAILNHKAYACRYPLHLTGYDDIGVRKRHRDLILQNLYYDFDVVNSQPGDLPMVIIDSDGAVFDVLHIKGSRRGAARPDFVIAGEDIEGGQIRIMDSSHHEAPEFKISGQGHDFKIRAAGLDSQEKATLINGKASYPGVTVR